MKNIILLLTAIICTSTGIYFDQILPICGGILFFYAYDYGNNYCKDLKINQYIKIFFLLLIQLGLMVYVVYDLFKSALLSVKKLLGTQPDFLYYLTLIGLCIIVFFAGELLFKKIRKYINQ